MAMKIRSSAFEAMVEIPRRFTCDGNDISPPIGFHGVPEGARSLALVMIDPDAPKRPFVHWLLYNLPPTTTVVGEAVERALTVLGEARQGVNDFGDIGYAGPCPPSGPAHRYTFRAYALDAMLDVEPGCKYGELSRAMETHILEQTELVGPYGRRGR